MKNFDARWEKFPSDALLSDGTLQLMSLDARAILPFVILLGQQSERRGFLLHRGSPINLESLSILAGVSSAICERGAAELLNSGWLDRDGDGETLYVPWIRQLMQHEAEVKAKNDRRKGRLSKDLHPSKSKDLSLDAHRSKSGVNPEYISDISVDISCESRESKDTETPPNPPKTGGEGENEHDEPARKRSRCWWADPAFTALPLPHGEAFAAAWGRWIAYRRDLGGKGLKPSGAEAQLKVLGAMSEAEAVRCIDFTIFKTWQGLQPAPSWWSNGDGNAGGGRDRYER